MYASIHYHHGDHVDVGHGVHEKSPGGWVDLRIGHNAVAIHADDPAVIARLLREAADLLEGMAPDSILDAELPALMPF